MSSQEQGAEKLTFLYGFLPGLWTAPFFDFTHVGHIKELISFPLLRSIPVLSDQDPNCMASPKSLLKDSDLQIQSALQSMNVEKTWMFHSFKVA